jgi:hypothetical protein
MINRTPKRTPIRGAAGGKSDAKYEKIKRRM